jgi:hypothetical protein
LIRRLLPALNVVALVLTTVLSGANSAMPDATRVAVQNVNHCCANCPSPEETGKLALPCNGMPACLGAITALPLQDEPILPAFSGANYIAVAAPALSGETLAPEPFPPRPIVLA